MSQKYPGGFITKSPVAPTATAASGVWTLDQQQQAQKAGTWPSPPIFIEDLFSTWLYTGNGASQTINNGIDLAGNGGLVWVKGRSAVKDNVLVDTVRGVSNSLVSNTASGQDFSSGNYVNAFSTTGFGVGGIGSVGGAGTTFATWTFREQPKFFSIATWTGNGVNGRVIPHNLGSTPGCIFVKRVSGGFGEDWQVYHRSLNSNQNLVLNTTAAAAVGVPPIFGTVDSTGFQLLDGGAGNSSGYPYIAYLFAHNAGGFPASGSGSTNGISCGSFTTVSGYSPNVELGYEPQWVLIKRTDSTGNWLLIDTMRGWVNPSGTAADDANLRPNLSDAENINDIGWPYATGFNAGFRGGSESTWIYIAIRRGPMKVPTDGTKVYTSIARAGTGVTTAVTGADFPPDFAMIANYKSGSPDHCVFDKLRSPALRLRTARTDAEANFLNDLLVSFNMDGITVGPDSQGETNNNTDPSWRYVNHLFRRAPGFFDEVCYTGTGTDDRQVTHNLGVAPELIICKSRNAAWPWWVGGSVLGSTRNGMYLNEASARQTNADAFSTNGAAFTSSYFLVSSVSAYPPNATGYTQVAYLFATCPGVSKVGSFTGTGATQVINCGFAGGARFVLIKATSTTGNWYVWDSARGIVAGNDPYLLLNSTAAEVTNTDWVDTATSGFELSNAGGNLANSNGVSYIFLAIA